PYRAAATRAGCSVVSINVARLAKGLEKRQHVGRHASRLRPVPPHKGRRKLLLRDPGDESGPHLGSRSLDLDGVTIDGGEDEVPRSSPPQYERAPPPSHGGVARSRAVIKPSLTASATWGAAVGCARSTSMATARSTEVALAAVTLVTTCMAWATAKPGESAPSQYSGGSHHPPNANAGGSSWVPRGGSTSTAPARASTSDETVWIASMPSAAIQRSGTAPIVAGGARIATPFRTTGIRAMRTCPCPGGRAWEARTRKRAVATRAASRERSRDVDPW